MGIDFRKKYYSFTSIFKRSQVQWRAHPLMCWGMNLAFRRAKKKQEARFATYFRWLRGQRRTSAPAWIQELAAAIRRRPAATLAD